MFQSLESHHNVTRIEYMRLSVDVFPFLTSQISSASTTTASQLQRKDNSEIQVHLANHV